MKYNVLTQLTSIDGTLMRQGPTENDPEATLRDILVQACAGADPRKHTEGREKYEIYQLMKKIHDNDEVDISSEEITLLKTLVGEAFSVVVVGPIYDLLENGTPRCPPRMRTTSTSLGLSKTPVEETDKKLAEAFR